MKLIHYTNEKFSLEPRKYDQDDVYWKNKPRGLWVSIEGKYDWKWWCEEEQFCLEYLTVSYDVKLKDDANILYLKTEEEVLRLSKIYSFIKPQWDNPEGRRICGSYEVDWKKIAEDYQGIIIAPYQWQCRFAELCGWYYGWDCASGCIWDLHCIKEIKLRDSDGL